MIKEGDKLISKVTGKEHKVAGVMGELVIVGISEYEFQTYKREKLEDYFKLENDTLHKRITIPVKAGVATKFDPGEIVDLNLDDNTKAPCVIVGVEYKCSGEILYTCSTIKGVLIKTSEKLFTKSEGVSLKNMLIFKDHYKSFERIDHAH